MINMIKNEINTDAEKKRKALYKYVKSTLIPMDISCCVTKWRRQSIKHTYGTRKGYYTEIIDVEKSISHQHCNKFD